MQFFVEQIKKLRFEEKTKSAFSQHWIQGRVSAYRHVNDEYLPTSLSNMTIDICKHSGGPLAHMFMATFLPDLLTKSNIDRPCPFSVSDFKLTLSFSITFFVQKKIFFSPQKQGTVYLRNFQFRSMRLPRIKPGEYLLDFVFYVRGLDIFTFNIQISVEVKQLPWSWWF